ncbi:hypothetical protein OG413_41260 [Streptomyces sp. NBC_01433]|uniref:hypothetical protein n=1 Tax=Streptomyces sp. NBC_01433 TaxID=2903864 RepID=UPI00224C940E|nr:hypothetical protein [Streptomyces sp. NBC_01433]MCX4681633.1 hypothetical protein [Streptomyces sp. NBC_01433]
MPSTSIALVDPRFLKARGAVTHMLASQTGTTEDIRADLALKTVLDAYGIPSEFWHTGGGCTARYVSFTPDGEFSEHQLHIAITDDASVDHPIAEHTGWLAIRHGPEFDGHADNELYNSELSLENPTLADMAHDSAGCARAIRDWCNGASTQWTRNEVALEGMAGRYRCQTRSEHWDAYCAPRFTPAVMRQICADTQAAHRAGVWNAPAHFEGSTVVIVTPSGRAEVRPDEDGHYRTGAFHWPWTEYTDRDVAPVTELVQTIRWKYEHEANSWTVITADHGWRAKVIHVLATPSPKTAPHVADALFNALYETALTSYEVTANNPGDAAAAVRAHFDATRGDRDPDATVQVIDLPGAHLPGRSS